jgi:hypothetical protein
MVGVFSEDWLHHEYYSYAGSLQVSLQTWSFFIRGILVFSKYLRWDTGWDSMLSTQTSLGKYVPGLALSSYNFYYVFKYNKSEQFLATPITRWVSDWFSSCARQKGRKKIRLWY